MDISAIFNFLKLSKKVYIVIGVISGILLFSPEHFLVKLSLLNFKENFNLWIGVIFLLSTGMTAVLILDSVFGFFMMTIKRKNITNRKKSIKEEKKREQAEAEIREKEKAKQAAAEIKAEEQQRYKEWKERHDKRIKSLDNDEKVVLREFYIQEKNTIEIVINNPSVIGLIEKGIIKQVSTHAYQDNFTGGPVAYFSVDEHTINYFGALDFPELNHLNRPQWLSGIEASKSFEQMKNKLSEDMIRTSKL